MLEDGFGSDVIYGGEGGTDSDTLDLSALGAGVTVTYTGDEQGTFSDGTDTGTFFGIENIVLTEQDDDFDASNDTVGVSVDGRGGDDTIAGSTAASSSNQLYGGAGNDVINADAGDDSIYGGTGNDTVFAGGADDTVYGGSGLDRIRGRGGNDTIYGGDEADYVDGDTGDDLIYGGAGADDVRGDGGNDTLYGGDDNDTFRVSNTFNTDTFYGGSGGTDSDTVDLSSLSAGVTVTYTDSEDGTFTDGTGIGTFDNIESFVLTSQDDDFDASHDTLGVSIDGRGGDDSLTGSQNSDLVDGGTGNDAIDGGEDTDTLYGGAGVDSIDGGNAGDALFGGADGDSISGGGGTDTLFGGLGNDTLTGGDGNDTLTGGASDDIFVLAAGSGDDTVTDFAVGSDMLDVSGLSDSALGGAADGSVTASEVVVTQPGGAGTDQILTFPNGETLTVSSGTVDTTSTATTFASLVAMGVPPCFAPGTLIGSARGPTPVELLRPGDLIETADRGLQPLLWAGRREVVFGPDNPRGDRDKPILIAAGALGGALPHRDLIVSPQHRMVLAGAAVLEHFGEREILALAKALTGLTGVRIKQGKRQIT